MRKAIAATVLLVLTLLLAACGGAGGPDAPPAGPTVSGVAAAGAAIAGTVSLKDSAAQPRELTQSVTDGVFSFDVTGLTKPFLLKVTGSSNGTPYTLYSLAPEQGLANINPLGNLVLAHAAAGIELAALHGAPGASGSAQVAARLDRALLEVRAALLPVLQKYGVAGVDPIRESFRVYQAGSGAPDQQLDRMLDLVQIRLDPSGSVSVSDNGAAPVLRQLATGFATRTVSGSVTLNGLPFAAVTVTVADAATGTVYGSAQSLADGRYLVANVPQGSVTVTPARSGYSFDRASSALSIAAADCEVPVFNSFQPYTVSGTVQSANGKGLAGVTVSARREGSAGVWSAVTDGSGRYSIGGLVNGSYSITPSRIDVLHEQAVSFDAGSRTVALSDSGNYGFADFSADLASFAVSGRLTRLANGEPMAGVSLTLVTKNNSGTLLAGADFRFGTVTDAAGNYSLSGIPSGYYALTPSLAQHAFALSAASSPAASADNFSVNAQDTRLDFTGRPVSDATGGLGGI